MKTINDLSEENKKVINALLHPTPEQSQSYIIRVVDDEGHLLFCYNPTTHSIEIKGVNRGGDFSTKRRKYSINVDILRKTGVANLISGSPVFEFKAEIIREENNGNDI